MLSPRTNRFVFAALMLAVALLGFGAVYWYQGRTLDVTPNAEAAPDLRSFDQPGQLLIVDRGSESQGSAVLRRPTDDECNEMAKLLDASVTSIRNSFQLGAREAGVSEGKIAQDIAVWEQSVGRSRAWIGEGCPTDPNLGVIDAPDGGKEWRLLDVTTIGSLTFER